MTWQLQEPGEEVVAVLAAAVDAAWPRAHPVSEEEGTPVTAWRFSGRWWARPLVARRERPWRW